MSESTPFTGSPPRRRRADSIAAEIGFCTRIAELGGRVVGKYVNGRTPVDCLCSAGHACQPRPQNVQQGRGMCRTCAGRDSTATERAFRARIASRGGTVVGEYLNSVTPVRCVCPEGHPCSPRPDPVLRGGGMCRTCGQHARDQCRSDAAGQSFKATVTAQGGRMVGGYVNSRTPVECVCANGHTCWPTPDGVKQRGNLCRTCSGKDPVAAESAFRAYVTERCGIVIGEYVNAETPVDCICPEGHACQPTPGNIQRGQGMCRTCVGHDPAATETAFRISIAERGGTVVGEYVGALTPVHCICPIGHDCYPWPTSIQQGRGMCGTCAGKVWDIFYVVTSPTRVKFGITSHDERRRLGDHRRAGYTEAVRVLPELPDAAALERHVLATLRDAGFPAVQGREHYDIGVLAVVLDVVDGWIAA